MRMLTIRNHSERYGSEGHLMRVAVGLTKQGWDVHAAFPKTVGTQSMIDDCHHAGIIYHPLGIASKARIGVKGSDTIRLFWDTLRLLKAVKPDVVQLTLGWPTEAFRFVIPCALLRIPTLVIFQLAPEKIAFSPALLQLLARARSRNQQWVAVSAQNREALAQTFQMPSEQIALIYNGADTVTAFTDLSSEEIATIRQDVRRELGLSANTRLLLTTGRISLQKGYFELAEIVAPIVLKYPDVKFVWVGTGEEKDTLSAQIRQQGLEDAVLFLGYRTDIPRLLKASDLFVFPSRFEGGCSSSIRETMAHGLPLVSTNAGGIPEVVTHEQHGLLTPPCSPDQLREAVEWALDHPEHMQELAANAKKRIAEFSVDQMVLDYKNAFEEIIRRIRRKNHVGM